MLSLLQQIHSKNRHKAPRYQILPRKQLWLMMAIGGVLGQQTEQRARQELYEWQEMLSTLKAVA